MDSPSYRDYIETQRLEKLAKEVDSHAKSEISQVNSLNKEILKRLTKGTSLSEELEICKKIIELQDLKIEQLQLELQEYREFGQLYSQRKSVDRLFEKSNNGLSSSLILDKHDVSKSGEDVPHYYRNYPPVLVSPSGKNGLNYSRDFDQEFSESNFHESLDEFHDSRKLSNPEDLRTALNSRIDLKPPPSPATLAQRLNESFSAKDKLASSYLKLTNPNHTFEVIEQNRKKYRRALQGFRKIKENNSLKKSWKDPNTTKSSRFYENTTYTITFYIMMLPDPGYIDKYNGTKTRSISEGFEKLNSRMDEIKPK